MSSRRREDRSTDPYKLWIPTTDTYDPDRRRYRSSTVPAHTHDQRPYPTHDTRYHDPRQPTRSNRHETQYSTAAPSYHQPAPGPSTTRTAHHASRPPAQYTQSGYQYQQPSSSQPSAHTQPSQVANAYPVATSSRRGYPEAPDPRNHTHRRAGTTPTPQSSYEKVSGTEDLGKASRHHPRSAHPSTQPPPAAPVNYSYLAPSAPDMSSRRPKDRDRERERDRDREADKASAELERDRYREKLRAERHRERERTAEADRHRDPSRGRHHDKRKESDSEGVMYAEHRNASRASLSGREGYASSSREPVTGHRRHRTEDGTAPTPVRRQQPETTQNPITPVQIHQTSEPQPDGMTPQQTGEPPPAPRVMPVYLPPKAPKSHRSQHERRMSVAAQGPQSGSDTERTSVKHRVERTQSGAAVQRSDVHVTNSAKDKGNHDIPQGPREEVKKKLESKYVPQVPNVDIPLVTPDYNVPSLPAEARAGGSTVPQFVSIRAGQGPSDPQAYDSHFKSAPALRSDIPQETIHVYPHATSASIVKPSGNTRSPSSEVPRSQADHPGVERSRTDPHVAEPAGPHMSTHEPSRGMPTQISRSQSSARGNLDATPESGSPAYLQGRPPSRPAHRASVSNVTPPMLAGPRPLRSASQGPQTNEIPARPPSVVHNAPVVVSAPSLHSIPPSPAHKSNPSPKTGHVHGPSHSVHPNPNDAQLQIGTQNPWSVGHATPTQQGPSAPPTTHPPPLVVPQNVSPSSQPSARPAAYPSTTRVDSATHHGVEQQPSADARFGPRQMTSQTPKSSTVKASWVVQTTSAPPPKGTVVSREDKYLRDHQPPAEPAYGTHAQLRQVLSQDQDPYPRAASSMMKVNEAMTPPTLSSSMLKATQATTPPAPSQRISPTAKAKDIQASSPRGTSANNSPRNGVSKEAPTPERMTVQDLPQPAPQIAVVGATPVAKARDLPQRVDNTLLVPPFPAPTRSSKTTSSSREHRSQTSHTSRHAPTVSQPPPPMPTPPMQPPLAYQPYPAPPAPVTQEFGQFSPPPLPIPPPRGLEDSPPPPIETRTSEMVPVHLQNSKDIEVSEVTRPARPEASLQPTAPTPLATNPATFSRQPWQSGRIESNAPLPVTQTTSLAVPQLDVRSPRPPDMLMVQSSVPAVNTSVGSAPQGIARSAPAPQTQPLAAPTRPRPKVTIEEVPEDSPIFSNTLSTSPVPMTPATSRPTPVSHHSSAAHTGSTAPVRSSTMDQAPPRSSPQSKVRDSPLHRTAEPATAPLVAPPMPPPAPTTTHAPSTSRAPFSAPPGQPTFFPSSQPSPTQRSTSQTMPSRPTQRATEPVQSTGKVSATSTSTATPVTAASAYAAAYTSKSTYPPLAVQSTSGSVPQTTAWQHQATPQVNTNSAQVPSATKPSVLTSASTYAAVASHASKTTAAGASSSAVPNTGDSVPLTGGALGFHVPATSSSSDPRHPEAHRNRPPVPLSSSQDHAPPLLSPSAAPAPKSQNHEQSNAESARLRDMSAATTRNYPTSSHPYTASARPGTSIAPSTQTQAPIPTVQSSSSHHRAASVPITQASSAAAANPSSSSTTRNFSQPIPGTTTSTQPVPFPSRPSPPESSTRVPVAGHLSTPAPPRPKGLPFPLDRATSNDSEMLKTPSSIARTPPTATGAVMQSTTIPIRTRQSSTDSKDSKKKASGLFNFGLFRTKSGSSKPVEDPISSVPAPAPARASVDHQRSHTDAPPPTATHRAHSSSVPKEAKERTTTSHPTTSAHAGPSFSQFRPVAKVPDPISIPPPTSYPVRDRKDSLSNIFTPFKFLTMNNKRNRTVSGASLDVCDGNTATNTVIGSPAHSTISQAPPFPPIVPPPVRDPMVATSQWRDREEAARRQRKSGRIRRPGVTFDVDEEPPPTKQRGAKLVRRKSGRAATPGPSSR